MNFNEYQAAAIRTAKPGDVSFNLMHAAMGLAGEAGEFVDAIKKHLVYGKPLDLANAKEEIGDLMWFVALACQTLQVSMEDIAKQNIAKLATRYPDAYSDFHATARLDK